MATLDISQTALLERLTTFFSTSAIEELSRESKFIQRSTSRISGMSFLLLNILQSSNGSESSFQDLCDWLEEHYDFNISKQGLWERYNTHAVDFMRSCFERCLASLGQGRTLNNITKKFDGINISDATSFKIPNQLSTFYPGTSSDSAIKLMYDYELISGQFKDLWIGAGSDSDCNFIDSLEFKIKPNQLYIKDLGFYKNEHFINISAKGAYFLSRCKVISTFHRRNEKGRWQSIPMEEIVAGVSTLAEFEVFLGKGQQKIPIRLIVEPVPDKIWEQRNERSRKSARSNNSQINPRTLALNRYSFWITNASAVALPKEMVKAVYFLRWQIELVFKTWKSLLAIHEVEQMNIFRFECYIYAKLIQVLLSKSFENLAQEEVWFEEEEISTWKATKIF